MLFDPDPAHQIAEPVPALLLEQELLEFGYGEPAGLIGVKDIKELLGVFLAHLHAILLEHGDYLLEFELAGLIFVEVLEYLHDVLVPLDLIAREHVLSLGFVLAALLEPLDDTGGPHSLLAPVLTLLGLPPLGGARVGVGAAAELNHGVLAVRAELVLVVEHKRVSPPVAIIGIGDRASPLDDISTA